MDSTGWGSPVILVPEATNIDSDTLNKLIKAEKELQTSNASPIGVPFQNLMNSASELSRKAKIKIGKPGSVCI